MEAGAATTGLCLFLIWIGLLMALAATAVRIVPEYQRLVVFRLGRVLGARGPGLVLLLPAIDRAIAIDLRETAQEFLRQSATTRDSISVSVDAVVRWKVVDPVQSVVCVGNLAQALLEAAVAALRSAIHDLPAARLPAERERIISETRARLDEATRQWGVEVTAVEVREIVVPPGVRPVARHEMDLIGARGKVGQSLMPNGTVLVELNAMADELLTTGEEVIVTGIEDSRLRVARAR
jgi:regulator of protease activity HflC (stomatin/prohibitin superfamily)